MNRFLLCLQYFIVFITFLSSALFAQTDRAEGGGFMVLAGNHITEDNSVLIASNMASTKHTLSFIKKYPETKHDSGDVVTLNNGLSIPRASLSYEWMALQTEQGIIDGNAVAVNQFGVAIGGSVSLGKDRNIKARQADPLVDDGLTREMVYIALQRSTSARECVRILGNMFNKYGIAHISGFAIADTEEIWYLETGGGAHWAAIKIPPDACWIQANSYRIGFIDPEDKDVMTSPEIKEFAKANGLWQSGDQLFNFARAFGGRRKKLDTQKYYNSRRIWRTYNLLITSDSLPPDSFTFPAFLRPEKKVSMEKLMTVLRDEYNETRFYPYQADTSIHIATSYQTDTIENANSTFIVDTLARHRDTTYRIDSTGFGEYPIASERIDHTSILELRSGLSSGLKSVLWAGFSNPVTTPYIPFYFGINEVPEPFNAATPDSAKASSHFAKLRNCYFDNPPKYRMRMMRAFGDFQKRCFKDQKIINQQAFRLYRTHNKMAPHFLTVTTDGYCQEALDLVKSMVLEFK